MYVWTVMAFLKDHSFREFSYKIIKTVLYLIGRLRIVTRAQSRNCENWKTMLHKRFDNSFDVLFPHRRNTSVSLKPQLLIVLTLNAPISACKFARLISMHFLKELVERIQNMIKAFFLWWSFHSFSSAFLISMYHYCKEKIGINLGFGETAHLPLP